MKIQWEDKYKIDIDKIDSQHKELFMMINRLIDAAERNLGKEEVGNLLKFLEEYVVKHFSLEERYMDEFEYKDYTHHRAQHSAFMANFLSLKKYYEAWGATSSFLDLVEKWVTNWLKDHILFVDQKFGEFLKSKGVHLEV